MNVDNPKQAHWSEALQAAWLERGPLAWALLPVATLHGLVVAVRAWLYRRGWMQSHELPVPVVVVGNLIAGGAGKTPTVLWLVQALRTRGWTPGVVSRGHGGSNEGVSIVKPNSRASLVGDEPLLLRLRGGAPVVVGRDRVAAAQALLAQHPAVDVIVSDDGLQHHRLRRVAQLIVFDERGAGNGWLLPAGPLREPLPRQVPPRSIVLYNAVKPSTPLPGHLARRRLHGAVSLSAWRRGELATAEALLALQNRPGLWAVAGIAQPARFFDMLEQHGFDIAHRLALPDHHGYPTLPWPPQAGDVLLTEKDAVKLDPSTVGSTRVWVVPLDFEPAAAFAEALWALLPPRSPR